MVSGDQKGLQERRSSGGERKDNLGLVASHSLSSAAKSGAQISSKFRDPPKERFSHAHRPPVLMNDGSRA